jgi:hypothetical protein
MVRAMEKRLLASCFTCVLALVAVGCDDDDQRSAPAYQSGVDADAPVAQLDDEEKRQICRSYSGYVDAYVGFDQLAYTACLPLSIVFGGGSRESCEAFLADCMESSRTPLVSVQASGQGLDEEVCFDNLEQCNASVAELEGCVNVNLGFFINILENFSCRSAEDRNRVDEVERLMDTAMVCSTAGSSCGGFADVEVF